MKVFVCFLFFVGSSLARVASKDSAPAPTLQDLDKDLDTLMEDERLFNEYYLCLLDLGPCTRDTNNFREVIQEALERGCARCTETQRTDAIQLLQNVMECRPREYAEIERHYDPSGTFKNKYKVSLIAKRMAFPLPLHGSQGQEEVEEEEVCSWKK